MNAPKLPFREKTNRRLGMAKGGGAIFSYVEDNPDHEWGLMELYVVSSCFFANRVYNGETGPANGGFDVLNVGDGGFRAYWTAFTTPETLCYQNSQRAQYCETKPCDIEVDVGQAEFAVAWNTTTRYSEFCGSLIYDWPPYNIATQFPSTETFAEVTLPVPPSTEPPTPSASESVVPVQASSASEDPAAASRSHSSVGIILGVVFGVVAVAAAALGFLFCRVGKRPEYWSDLYQSMIKRDAGSQYDFQAGKTDMRMPAPGDDGPASQSGDGTLSPLWIE
jgi:hypothetical protein